MTEIAPQLILELNLDKNNLDFELTSGWNRDMIKTQTNYNPPTKPENNPAKILISKMSQDPFCKICAITIQNKNPTPLVVLPRNTPPKPPLPAVWPRLIARHGTQSPSSGALLEALVATHQLGESLQGSKVVLALRVGNVFFLDVAVWVEKTKQGWWRIPKVKE